MYISEHRYHFTTTMCLYNDSFQGVIWSNLHIITKTYLTNAKCTTFDGLFRFVCAVHADSSAQGDTRADVFVNTMSRLIFNSYPSMPVETIRHDCKLLFFYCISALCVGDRLKITWCEGENHGTYDSRITHLCTNPYTFIVECDGHSGQWHFDASIDAWSMLHAGTYKTQDAEQDDNV